MLDLVFHPNELLATPCSLVTAFDAELKAFVDQMVETMYASNGVGLAAPQVGATRCILTMDPTGGEETDTLRVLVNPRVTWRSPEVEQGEEGCLSLPGVKLLVLRSLAVNVEYHDLAGKAQQSSYAGLAARIVQHEIDHLDGTLMFDRVGPMARRQALRDIPRNR
jgi:peptide deformylase